MNKYYTYVHYRKSDGTPFYVGKGHGKRAWVFSKRNIYWNRTKNAHGIVVEVVFENLTEEEAFQCEKDTILEFNYFGYKLTNMTSGGEGCSGVVLSAEARKRISEFHKGRVFSEEHLRKISISNTGKVTSDSTKEKQRQAKLGKYIGNNNPFADLNIYTFVRLIDDLHFTGTRSDVCSQFNLKRNDIKKLFLKQPRVSAGGWKLKGEINDPNN